MIVFINFANAEFIVQSYQTIKNKKVVRQNYEESCGASSLAILLNILDNRNFTELEILKIMSEKNLNTDMVSFTTLKTAVQKLGFEANSYALNKGDYLQVLDPSYGEYISSKR